MLDQWRATGTREIAEPEGGRHPLPWAFDGTVFRSAWEYPVADFEAEVGFWIDVAGFSTLALNDGYALFTTVAEDFTFACRRRDPGADLSGHILCFMTKDIEAFAAAIEARMPEGSVSRRTGSPVQTVLGIQTPAGLQVDIWEFPS